MVATYSAIERNKKPAGALEIPEDFQFYYLNKKDRQIIFGIILIITLIIIDYYINLVSEKYTLRKMIEVATNIVTKATNVENSAADTIDEAEKDILNISKFRKTSEFRKIQDVLAKTQEDIARFRELRAKLNQTKPF